MTDGAKRPGYKPSAKASRDVTNRKSVFHDLKPDTTTIVRLLPPSDPSGAAFFVKTDHYKLTSEDNKPTAMPCLDTHGDDDTDCPICLAQERLSVTGDKGDSKIANNIKASSRWYVQAYVKDMEDQGPKLIGLSRTTADKISEILSVQEDTEEPLLNDPDGGQWVMLIRKGSGLGTRYDVQVSSKAIDLDDLRPTWTTEFIEDVPAACRLKVASSEDMIEAFRRSYGDELDVDSLLS
jgi:hypothetical protein